MNLRTSVRTAIISITCAALGAMASCATGVSSGPISGQVLEEATNRPIPDAWVVVRWDGGGGSMFGHGSTYGVHVEVTRSGADGRFKTKPWKEEVSTKLSPIYLMYAYKRGYERIDTQKEIDRVEAGDNRIFMKPFNGTREERFAYLLSDRPTTGWGRLVLPVFQAIYAELSNLAASQDEMEKARRYAISASNQVLLFMQGSRRHDEFTREIQDFSKENFK